MRRARNYARAGGSGIEIMSKACISSVRLLRIVARCLVSSTNCSVGVPEDGGCGGITRIALCRTIAALRSREAWVELEGNHLPSIAWR